jgi:hypothetical protein
MGFLLMTRSFSFSQNVSKLYYDKRQEAEGEKGEEEIKEAFFGIIMPR